MAGNEYISLVIWWHQEGGENYDEFLAVLFWELFEHYFIILFDPVLNVWPLIIFNPPSSPINLSIFLIEYQFGRNLPFSSLGDLAWEGKKTQMINAAQHYAWTQSLNGRAKNTTFNDPTNQTLWVSCGSRHLGPTSGLVPLLS